MIIVAGMWKNNNSCSCCSSTCNVPRVGVVAVLGAPCYREMIALTVDCDFSLLQQVFHNWDNGIGGERGASSSR